MISTTPNSERRQSDRRRACLGGTLRIAAFLPDLECRLRDLSLTGARLIVAEDASLPRLVDLTVACRNETRRARVVWRNGTHVGLAFFDTPAPWDSGQAVSQEPPSALPPSRLH